MCDLAWHVVSERVRAVALADRQALYMAALMAGVKVDLPDPEDTVDELTRLLAAPPAGPKADRELRDMLGVA